MPVRMKAKHFLFVLPMLFFILLLVCFSPHVSASGTIYMNVESFARGNTYNNTDISVSGWAISTSGVASVDVSVIQGSHVLSQSITGSSLSTRGDVHWVYPTFPDSVNSGFSFTFGKDTVPIGTNSIRVTVHAKDGSTQTAVKNITMQKLPQLMTVDSYNRGLITNPFSISGWAISPTGVGSVYAALDGVQIGTVTYADRSDVRAVYPAYAATNPTSGFEINCTPNLAASSSGRHTLTVTVVGKDGTQTTAVLPITKAQPQMNVESLNPISQITNSTINVSGWAINPSGLDHVVLTVSQGSTSVTQTVSNSSLGTRNDVGIYYPQYPDSDKSGFTFSLAKNAVPAGYDTFQLTTFGKDGSSQVFRKTINVKKLPPEMNVESFSKSTYYNSDIGVSGWAINESGISSIDISVVQGSHKVTGSISPDNMTRRNDVAACYPSYSNSGMSGFSYGFNVNAIPAGSNTIYVTVNGVDGSKLTSVKTVNVVKPAQLMNVDSCNGGYITSDFNINGWAANKLGIQNVYATLDGSAVGTVSFSRRDDVLAAYPSYAAANPNSGFTIHCTPDLSKYTVGSHKLVVTAVANDGTTTSMTLQVKKASPIIDGEGVSAGQSFPFNGTINLYGWAVNASGVNNVKVYMDSTSNLVSTISSLNYCTDIQHAVNKDGNGGYYDAYHSRYSATISVENLSLGKYHTIIIVATGNDGTTATGSIPIYISSYTYTHFNVTLSQLANSNRVSLTTVDPNSIKSASASGVYQFLSLHWVDGITADELNAMLSNCGVIAGKGSAFLSAAKQYDINPVYLIAHCRIESGNGTSTLAKGVYVAAGTYTNYYGSAVTVSKSGTYYNLFGIHAFDSTPVTDGSRYAASMGWDTVEKAIAGGAQWIHQHYVGGYEDHGGYDQNTLYEMKWDPYGLSKGHAYEYATDVDWPVGISNIINQYAYLFKNVQFKFYIPSFN